MKRFLSLFLVVVLLVSALSGLCVSAEKQPTFVVGNTKGEVGDTVKVEISVKNNPGVIAMQVLVEYDAKALKLKKTYEGKFPKLNYSPLTNNPFATTWVDPINPNNDTNGVLVTLEFEILDTAPNGKSELKLSYDPENVFELNTSAPDNFKNVHFEVENGYVDITNPNPPKPQDTSSQESAPSQQNSSESVSSEKEQSDSSDKEQTQNPSKITQVDSNSQNSSKVDTGSEIVSSETPIVNDDDSNTINTDSAESIDITDDATNTDSQNGWLIWVVVAAIVVLGGSFAVVIIKSKKQ